MEINAGYLEPLVLCLLSVVQVGTAQPAKQVDSGSEAQRIKEKSRPISEGATATKSNEIIPKVGGIRQWLDKS